MKILLILISAITLAACSWVNENPNGQSVAITTSSNCPQVGTINVSTQPKIGFVKRGKKKILSELRVLARNEALKINANTIIPQGEPVEGKQRYLAYACPR